MIYLLIALLGAVTLLSCFITGRRTEDDNYGNRAMLTDISGFLPLSDEGLILAERTTLGGEGCDVDLRRLAVEGLLAVIELRDNDFYLLPMQAIISEVDLQILRGKTQRPVFGDEPFRLMHGDQLMINYVEALRFTHY